MAVVIKRTPWRTLWLPTVSLLAGATLAAAAGLPDPDVRFVNERGRFQHGHRCAAPEVSATEAALVASELSSFQAVFGKSASLADPIPVAVHVIFRKKNKRAIGKVSDRKIEEQMDALNAAFAGTGISFRLASVDRTSRRKWFLHCLGSAESKMKERLAVDPATTLNLYTCKPGGGRLGSARFPWEFEESSSMHGVVVRHSTLPGGKATPFNLGQTAVHEVGHFLGLLHTFQDGCFEPGDTVADTPAEGYPAFGCPVGRDSCIGGGSDPVFNYMDYSDDACMDRFTAGQVDRMREIVGVFRPSL